MQTETLILMAVYSENMYPSVCIEAVEKLGQVIFICQFSCEENGSIHLLLDSLLV